MLDKLELNSKAQELRELLGEDANSPVDIFSLVSQIERLTLVIYPLGENISGMCVRDNKIRLIAINSTMSFGRQRYSIAHELYHLYFDDESGFNVCSTKLDPKSVNEKCADQFASYFLAPYKSFRAAVKKLGGINPLSLQHVIALEQYFGMSHQAMLWRLVSEGYLSSDNLKDYINGVITTARKLGYDDKLYKPTPIALQKRTYGYYLKQVEELRQKDLVSSGKIDELLLDAFRDDIAYGLDEEDQGGEIID
ncbi:MAG: ImmA/IrrE family metallo-endopeptidase [Thermotogaceae bacterium]|nr:ImmA/IrrE family metallo-endopeptidase [Thermotogaceae bacterium]